MMITADDILDQLADLEANLRAGLPTPTQPGVYRLNGQLYMVKIGRQSKRPYAMRDVNGTWEYAPSVIGELRTVDALTLEQAKAYGRATGYCACCGRFLSDPVSVEHGIGPICEGRWYGGTRKSKKAKAT